MALRQRLAGWSEDATASIAAAEEGEIAFKVGSAEARPGETVDIPVEIVENPGAAGIMVQLSFDRSKLTPVSVRSGDISAIDDANITSNIQAPNVKPEELDVVTAHWDSAVNTTDTGVAFVFTFKVAAGASGEIPITLSSPNSVSDQSLNLLKVISTDGGVNVVNDVKPVQHDYEITGITQTEDEWLTVANVAITKKTDREAKDTLFIASYGRDGDLIDHISLKMEGMTEGQSTEMGSDIITDEGGRIKAFIWNGTDSMQPLSNSFEVSVAQTQEPEPQEPQEPTAEEYYNRMIALQEKYPEGTPWDNSVYYEWDGGIYSRGYGCAGFAFMLSDAAFGKLPARKVEEVKFADVRVGDILRLDGDSHSVIILEVNEDGVTIAEGNYSNSVHWGRKLKAADVEKADYMLTRYPEE